MRRVNGYRMNDLSNGLGNDFGHDVERQVDNIFAAAKLGMFINGVIIIAVLGLTTWGFVYLAGSIKEEGVKGLIESVWNGSGGATNSVENSVDNVE